MGFLFSCAIILRIDGSAASQSGYAESIKSAADTGGIPLIWNLSDDLAGNTGINDFLSSGRSGLPHPFLSEEELKAEIHLAHSDTETETYPWLLPHMPDLCRGNIRSIYNKRSRLLLTRKDQVWIIQGSESRTLPLLELDGMSNDVWEKKSLKQCFRDLRKKARQAESPGVILIDNPAEAMAEEIFSLLAAAVTSLHIKPTDLSGLLSSQGPEQPGVPPALPSFLESTGLLRDPVSRQQRSVPWTLPDETRLKRLSGDRLKDFPSEADIHVTHRDLIANMPGEVYMYEGETGAVFNKGDLASLYLDKKRPIVNGAARAFIQCSRRELPRQSGSCTVRRIGTFSFDDYPARGLRDSLSFTSSSFSSPARIHRDFFFVSGDTRLCISFFIEYPGIEDPDVVVESFGFMEIPLAKAAGKNSYSVETRYPDGTKGSCRFTEPGEYLLTGSSFTFPSGSGSLTLSYSENSQSVQELQVSLRRGKLYLNPRGSYAPVLGTALSGLREQFSIVLDLENNVKKREETGLSSLKPYVEAHRIFKAVLQTHRQ